MSRSEGLQYLALIQVLFKMSTIQAERGKKFLLDPGDSWGAGAGLEAETHLGASPAS